MAPVLVMVVMVLMYVSIRWLFLLALVAFAVLSLAQLMDMCMAIPCAVQETEHGVHRKAQNYAADDLDQKDCKHAGRRLLVGQKYRQHLIGGGKDDSDKRACRDDAARIERCCHGREPALRKGTQKGPDGRAGLARLAHDLLRLSGRSMLERFHRKIGKEEEGHELERVPERVYEYIEKEVHVFYLQRASTPGL